MVPRHFVPAHRTQLLQVLVVRVVHHFKLRRWNETRKGHTHPVNFPGRLSSCGREHSGARWANAHKGKVTPPPPGPGEGSSPQGPPGSRGRPCACTSCFAPLTSDPGSCVHADTAPSVQKPAKHERGRLRSLRTRPERSQNVPFV